MPTCRICQAYWDYARTVCPRATCGAPCRLYAVTDSTDDNNGIRVMAAGNAASFGRGHHTIGGRRPRYTRRNRYPYNSTGY